MIEETAGVEAVTEVTGETEVIGTTARGIDTGTEAIVEIEEVLDLIRKLAAIPVDFLLPQRKISFRQLKVKSLVILIS